MSLTSLRDDLRAPLEDQLTAGIVYYPFPAEVVVVPSVVFVPRDPWWRPRTIGDPNAGVRVEFDLQLLVARGVDLGSAFDALESLALQVGAAMAEAGVLWQDLGAVEPIKVGDVDALVCRMAYAVTV